MKVIVFGATGKVGRHVTAQALEQGYEVTAFVRDASADLGSDPKLTLVVGDVLDAKDVENAIVGMMPLWSLWANRSATRTD